jgi:hypothetical protein
MAEIMALADETPGFTKEAEERALKKTAVRRPKKAP